MYPAPPVTSSFMPPVLPPASALPGRLAELPLPVALDVTGLHPTLRGTRRDSRRDRGIRLAWQRRAAPRYGSGVSIPRGTTLAGRLASLGFADADRAERLIAGELALDIKGADGALGADGPLVEALAAAADPDAALAGLA